jgi:uncharacterized sodium:solute symporter family permease YidK
MMNSLSIVSFLGFTLLFASISKYATSSKDEKSADGYYIDARSLTAIKIGDGSVSDGLNELRPPNPKSLT